MNESDITLTESDCDRTIAVAPGVEFAVDLEENATTGFRWSVELDPAARALVEVIDERFVSPTALAPGSAGRRVWRFRTTSTGTARLRFTLRQPWEESTPAANEVSFTVEV